MRTMCDACYPGNYEAGHDLYASYVDGSCASNANTAVRISSLASNAGNVGDCEPGNPAPARWVSWVQQRRAAGVDPTIYVAADQLGSFFNGYKLQNVRAAFQAAGVPEPHYWICYPGLSYIPDSAVAVQTGFMGGFDISLVVDYWPGVDTADPPPDPPPPPAFVPIGGSKTMIAFDLTASGGMGHQFELGTDGNVYWGRFTGGAGGQVHAGFVSVGGNGPGPVREFTAWPDSTGQTIVVRTKYDDGKVLQLWLQANGPWPQDLNWFAPDNAGPFGISGLPGPPGPNTDEDLRAYLKAGPA